MATVKLVLSVMASANGLLQGAGLLASTSQSQVTTRCAIVKCLLMHPSAMELINISGSGRTNNIVDSGVSGQLFLSGARLATGCSPSTDEQTPFAYSHTI